MAIKSVLDVEVNDTAFRQFVSLYEKYQEQLKKTPDLWKRVGDAIDQSLHQPSGGGGGGPRPPAPPGPPGPVSPGPQPLPGPPGGPVTPSQARRDRRDAERGQHEMARSAREQAHSWRNLTHSSKQFSLNVVHATRSMMRWVGFTTLAGGLLGGGGLFGLGRLASTAGSMRRSSLGLGLAPGEGSAFDIDYGRVLDTHQFLAGVNEALHDVTKRSAFAGAGVTDKDLAGKDTAQVAAMLIPHLKDIADKSDPRMLANTFRARHLNQFMSFQDFQRLRATPKSELAEYGQQYETDRKELSLKQEQLKGWQDLQVQLKRAGTQIENTFIKGLAGLAEPIAHLSKSFSDLVASFTKSPTVKKWLDDLADGLESAAKYIDTPEFKQDVENFAADIGKLAVAIGHALKKTMEWVLWLEGASPADVGDAIKNGGVNGPISPDNPNMPGSPAWNRAHGKDGGGGGGGTTRPNGDTGGLGGTLGGFRSFWGGNAIRKSAYMTLEDQNDLPRGLLGSVEYNETRGRDLTSDAGAEGFFQFMRGTAQRYGVDVHNEGSSAKGAAAYFRDLMRMFNGNLEQSVAAYNWGEGNVQKDIAAHGARWKDFLPGETQQYVSNVIGALRMSNSAQLGGANDRHVTITVNNNTGGNATVTSSQLAI